jgi:hypothetical protein
MAAAEAVMAMLTSANATMSKDPLTKSDIYRSCSFIPIQPTTRFAGLQYSNSNPV